MASSNLHSSPAAPWGGGMVQAVGSSTPQPASNRCSTTAVRGPRTWRERWPSGMDRRCCTTWRQACRTP
eukprot:5222359-Pyramimonas_sp.AAC.1